MGSCFPLSLCLDQSGPPPRVWATLIATAQGAPSSEQPPLTSIQARCFLALHSLHRVDIRVHVEGMGGGSGLEPNPQRTFAHLQLHRVTLALVELMPHRTLLDADI